MTETVSSEASLAAMPRQIDAQKTFDSLVNWVHDELIVKRKAPGFVVGISGTDSILTFLVCAEAFKRAGKPERVVGIHYGAKIPNEDSMSKYEMDEMDDPEQGTCNIGQDFWFQKSVLPWLKERAPESKILVDSSINYNSDSHRWAGLMDYSVLSNPDTGAMRRPGDNFWLVGTRNATEKALRSYSNISALASVQPLEGLWKSEILKICEHLHVPEAALQKSRIADCKCGRFTQQAVHIEEVDALLMTHQGLISPEYVQNTIPRTLRGTLENFIATQRHGAAFKEEIPYVPENSIAATVDPLGREFAAAKRSAYIGGDVKDISAIVPDIIKSGNANAASDLVCSPAKDQQSWLAEAFSLFNTPGLRISQRRSMCEKIFAAKDTSVPEVVRLSKCTGRIGDYGFSFPRLRFVCQHSGNAPALVESFGMQRQVRDSDVRNAALAPSDPKRDELGTGFSWHDDKHYVEYRRSYIVCSDLSKETPATIVIRNNSHFFGRDRLPSAAYISTQLLTPDELKNLTPDMLENSGRFTKWQDVAKVPPGQTLDMPLRRTEKLLTYLDDFEAGLNSWFKSNGPTPRKNAAGPDHSAASDTGGLGALVHFLDQKAAGTPPGIGKPPLFLGSMHTHSAPWFPKSSIALTPAIVDQLKEHLARKETDIIPDILSPGHELVLMSGKNGDYPVGRESQIGR